MQSPYLHLPVYVVLYLRDQCRVVHSYARAVWVEPPTHMHTHLDAYTHIHSTTTTIPASLPSVIPTTHRLIGPIASSYPRYHCFLHTTCFLTHVLLPSLPHTYHPSTYTNPLTLLISSLHHIYTQPYPNNAEHLGRKQQVSIL